MMKRIFFFDMSRRPMFTMGFQERQSSFCSRRKSMLASDLNSVSIERANLDITGCGPRSVFDRIPRWRSGSPIRADRVSRAFCLRNHEDPTHSQNSAATNGGYAPAQLIILEYLHFLAAFNLRCLFCVLNYCRCG